MPNKSNEELKRSIDAYLHANPDCTAQVLQPTGMIAEVIQGNEAIHSYLQGLLAGRPMTPRSWFGESEDPMALLHQLKSIIESTKINSSFSDEIKQFDLSYESKFGEQGGTPPIESSVEIILQGFSPSKFDVKVFDDPLWQQAKEILRKRYKFTKTRKPWSYPRVLEDKAFKGRLSRYAGFPTGGKKNSAPNQEKAMKDATTGRCFEYPAMILFRFYKGKLRLLWMYPFAMTLKGASFEGPLMEHLRALKLTEFAPWEGFDQVKEALTEIWNPDTQKAFGGDTSRMDDHMLEPLNMEAFDVFKYAFEERYWHELEQIIRWENNIPLLINDDILLVGPHGKASGADFTQMTETIYQAIIHEWIKLKYKELTTSMYIGDDYEAILNSLEKWAHVFIESYDRFGLPGKEEKQSDEVGLTTFLQRLFVKDWKARGNSNILGGIYSTISALRSMVYPENWIDPEDYPGRFSDMFCVKIFMILENTVDSPYFDEYVKWAVHKQKDLIPFAKKAFSEIDKIWKLSKPVRGIGESYNQEKQDKPISSYMSIAVARSL